MKNRPYNFCGPGYVSPEATKYEKGGMEDEKSKSSDI
jgi:hypothetical protein